MLQAQAVYFIIDGRSQRACYSAVLSLCAPLPPEIRNPQRHEVPFWFREASLKPYQKAYRIVDEGDTRTPTERSLMNSCVCTEDTRYADVAAQLFTAEVRVRVRVNTARVVVEFGVRVYVRTCVW